jgi:hypothetical protein
MAKLNKESKTETLILRVPNQLKTILQDLADNDNRKLSDYVRLQLMRMANYTPKKR